MISTEAGSLLVSVLVVSIVPVISISPVLSIVSVVVSIVVVVVVVPIVLSGLVLSLRLFRRFFGPVLLLLGGFRLVHHVLVFRPVALLVNPI